MHLCVSCKGRGYCGRRCAILERTSSMLPVLKKLTYRDIAGSSPPGVFVGRHGYPKVNVGLLVPQVSGDTAIFDSPSSWYSQGSGIREIMGYRSELINSSFASSVRSPSGFIDLAHDIALSKRSVDMELSLKKIPSVKISYDSMHAPMGPMGSLEKARISSNPVSDKRSEYLAYDTSACATDSISELYASGADIGSISKLLSVGLLGAKSQRRLVPTRWSITAVDDSLGKQLLSEIRSFEWIDSFRFFFNSYLGNSFAVLLMPRFWSFELVEAYYPGSVWLMQGERKIISDHETNLPRKSYASNTGGAYYAIRLAVLEYLKKIRRQASVLVLREVGKDYYAPLGVWVTRETVRDCFSKGLSFNSLEGSLEELSRKMRVSRLELMAESSLISDFRKQKTLRDFSS